MEILLIAFRSIFRNPRRTLLNILAITIGVMVILNLSAWIRGVSQSVYQSQMDLDTGHVQILNKDYQAEKTRQPLDLGLDRTSDLVKALADQPGLRGLAPRIDFGGEITNGVTGIPVQVRAVDPQAEQAITKIHTQVVAGSWFANGAGLLVGDGLAKKLSLSPGSSVFLNALDKYGVRNLSDGQVVGIFHTGFPLIDDRLVITNLDKAREILSLPADFSTRLVLRFDSSVDTAGETRQIQQAVAAWPEVQRAPLTVYEWKEFAQTIVSSIESRIKIMTFMLSILVLLVAIGILNSLSMSVQERYREIGTLRAIGMNRRKIRQLFLTEGAILGVVGGLSGALIGGILLAIFTVNGVNVGAVADTVAKDLPIPLIGILRPVSLVSDFVATTLGAALIAVLGAWQPAVRAAKLEVREVLATNG